MTIMIEPSRCFESSGACADRHTAIVRSVRRSSSARALRPSTPPRHLRDEVPIPPFHPKATVPVPAPTLPSSTGPPVALRIAAKTSSRPTWRAADVVERAVVRLADDDVDRPDVLVARQREHVVDQRIGDARHVQRRRQQRSATRSRRAPRSASIPSASRTRCRRRPRAGTFSRKRFPPCGRIAVTPVRTFSPRMTVVCPTRTPATSVIAFSAPVGRLPTTMPISRARGRAATVVSVARSRVKSEEEMHGMNDTLPARTRCSSHRPAPPDRSAARVRGHDRQLRRDARRPSGRSSAASSTARASSARPSAVITFHPHPLSIVAPDRVPKQILTLPQKEELLRDDGRRRAAGRAVHARVLALDGGPVHRGVPRRARCEVSGGAHRPRLLFRRRPRGKSGEARPRRASASASPCRASTT